jgi:prolyl-tRNA editing enzyme YbaK/EbsC (Cys-tRNA(Pro) deacylase)
MLCMENSDNLHFESAISRPDLLPPAIIDMLKNWSGSVPVEDIWVTPIDPEYADSAKFCERYGVDPAAGANCVVAMAVRAENRTFAACLVPVNCRADLNNVARKTLGARRVSFAPLEEVIRETRMEYGGITPIGLPASYPILIDSRIAAMERLIIGGGYRKSKLSVPGKALAELPGALVIEGLGVEIP